MGDQELLDDFIKELPDIKIDVIKSGELVDIISIDNQGLERLPSSIAHFASLRVLYLRDNKLSELPTTFKYLKHLERLELGNNNFEEFPNWVSQCTGLQILNLDNNKIDTIPDQINQLQNLRGLSVASNRIDAIPDQIELPNLEEIDLSGNQINSFPAFEDNNVLRSINLRDNQIPNCDGAQNLFLLEKIDLSKNQISSPPIELLGLEYLIEVNLSDNPVEVVNKSYPGKFQVKKLVRYLRKFADSESIHTCLNCGHSQGIAIVVCQKCNHDIDHCYICKKGFLITSPPSCGSCGALFHEPHILKALKFSRQCPACKDTNTITL